jgi:autotransporter-associated beta strand protein
VGTGRLVLRGVNGHGGGTAVLGGTLEVAQGGSLAADVLNSATLINQGSLLGTFTTLPVRLSSTAAP